MITSVAIKINSVILSMPRPARHHDVLRQIGGLYEPSQEIPPWIHEDMQEGFLTSEGIFLDREEAYKYVMSGKSVMQEYILKGHRYEKENSYQGDELFSEDLW